MPEQAQESAPEAQASAPQSAVSPQQATPADLKPETGSQDVSEMDALSEQLAKWKSMARKNEDAAKRNAEKAKAFDEYEASQRTEAEKAQVEIEALKAQVAAQSLQILRSQVAAEKGLEPELAETLTGDNAEAMAEHADRLIAAIKRRFAPKSNPTPEQTGEGANGQTLDQQIAAAVASGDFATSMQLKNQAVLKKARQL